VLQKSMLVFAVCQATQGYGTSRMGYRLFRNGLGVNTRKCRGFSSVFWLVLSNRLSFELQFAVIDFIYYAQLQVHTSKTLLALETALKTFHENKDVFIREGIREHFNIPKIHQMMHYVEAIRSHGTADGYNTEASERLHIDYAKEGYRASNKKDYIKQMTVWLGRQEAVSRFQAYLVYAAKQKHIFPRFPPT
jgi:hypothetical protein